MANICTRDAILRACSVRRSSIGGVRKVANSCNVEVRGFSSIWPFSMLGVRWSTCAQLMMVNPEDLLRKGLDMHMLEQLLLVTDKPNVSLTDYDGYIENGIFALLFLLKRNHKECVILTNFEKTVKRIMKYKDMTLERLDWSDISILWDHQKLSVPGKNVDMFIQGAAKCLSKASGRFMLSLITIVSDHNVHHANILLFDKITGILERFDPYQVQLEDFHTEELDIELEKLFRKIVPSKFKSFIRPVNLSQAVRDGLQQKAEREDEQTPNDPLGFCQPWTIMYADARMSLPNQDPSSIPELFQLMASDRDLSLTSFIRNYAQNLEEVNNKVYMSYLMNHPEFHKYIDPRIPMYALFMEELFEYAAVYT
jgi:hypothetical protein